MDSENNLRCSDEIIEAIDLTVEYQHEVTTSKTVLTLRSRVPARCHSSPNSPPPRIFGTASIAPYLFRNVSIAALKNGLIEIVKPPYPDKSIREWVFQTIIKPTILYRWCSAVKFCILMAHNEHGHFGSILAGIPNLLMQYENSHDYAMAICTPDEPRIHRALDLLSV